MHYHPFFPRASSLPRFFYFGGDIISRGALVKIEIIALQPYTTHYRDLEKDEFVDKLYTAPEGRLSVELYENDLGGGFRQLAIKNIDVRYERTCALYIRSL